jgi:hypothetical protein
LKVEEKKRLPQREQRSRRGSGELEEDRGKRDDRVGKAREPKMHSLKGCATRVRIIGREGQTTQDAQHERLCHTGAESLESGFDLEQEKGQELHATCAVAAGVLFVPQIGRQEAAVEILRRSSSDRLRMTSQLQRVPNGKISLGRRVWIFPRGIPFAGGGRFGRRGPVRGRGVPFRGNGGRIFGWIFLVRARDRF